MDTAQESTSSISQIRKPRFGEDTQPAGQETQGPPLAPFAALGGGGGLSHSSFSILASGPVLLLFFFKDFIFTSS